MVSRILNVYMLVLSLLSRKFSGSVLQVTIKKISYTVRKEVVFRVVVHLLQHDSVAESATFRR